METSKIIEELRRRTGGDGPSFMAEADSEVLNAAADAIARLEAEVAERNRALTEFQQAHAHQANVMGMMQKTITDTSAHVFTLCRALARIVPP